MSATNEALRQFLFAFADDEHLMGQQHVEWIGVAPFLEEDLAFSSIGQDELGHAVMLYELICELDGVDADDARVDELAYGRGAAEYRSSAFTEFGTTDWAEALVLHWVYDMVEDFRWQSVSMSSYAPLASAAVRAQREESYHRRHATALIDSLISTPARAELERGLVIVTELLPSLLSPVANVDVLVAESIISQPLADYAPAIVAHISETLGSFVLGEIPSNGRTERSDAFAPLMARMREVLDLDPKAVW